jgi:hypothetical protein
LLGFPTNRHQVAASLRLGRQGRCHARDTARAMSQENVEIVGRIYERLNRGDVEGVVELCGDDFLIDMSERVFNPDTYRGHDGIRRFYEGVQDAWESYRWDVEETHIAGRRWPPRRGSPRGRSSAA